MNALIASLAALAVGPLLTAWWRGGPASLAARTLADGLDALFVVTIGALVCLDILPHSIAVGGGGALAAALVGCAVPMVAHGPFVDCAHRASRPLVALGTLALALHAIGDGAALVAAGPAPARLAAAVIVHRLVEGLGVWCLLRPNHGPAAGAAGIALVAAATLAGYGGAGWLAAHGGAGALALLQAGVAGSLLHVLLRHGPAGDGGGSWHLASGLGALAGVAVVAALAVADPHGHHHAGAPGVDVAALARVAAPGLLLAMLVASVCFGLAPPSLAGPQPRRARPGGLGAAWRGAWRGLAAVECSCGVLPAFRGLLERWRLPTGEALAFLVAAPLLGLPTLVLSAWLLGLPLTAARLALGLACATGAGWAAGGCMAAACTPVPPPPRQAWGPRDALAAGARFALGDVLHRLAPWTLFGLLLAAAVPLLEVGVWAGRWRAAGLEVVVLAAVGLPFFVSAQAASLGAGALAAEGVSPAAVLAFLATASAGGLGPLAYVRRHLGAAAAGRVLAATYAVAVAGGLVLERLGLRAVAWAPPARPGSSLATLAVALLFAYSLLRQGMRLFVRQVALPNSRTVAAPSHEGAPAPAAAAADLVIPGSRGHRRPRAASGAGR